MPPSSYASCSRTTISTAHGVGSFAFRRWPAPWSAEPLAAAAGELEPPRQTPQTCCEPLLTVFEQRLAQAIAAIDERVPGSLATRHRRPSLPDRRYADTRGKGYGRYEQRHHRNRSARGNMR